MVQARVALVKAHVDLVLARVAHVQAHPPQGGLIWVVKRQVVVGPRSGLDWRCLVGVCERGEVETSVLGLILPEIVYNIKKKLGCIFVENHNFATIMLKRGQWIGLVRQEEQGQLPVKCKEDTPSITEWK